MSALALGHLDPRTEAYADEVVHAVAEVVPDVEAYLVGSGAAGGFDPERRHLDLVVVLEHRLGAARQPLVERLATTDCPVRAVELVAYAEGAQPPDFELNLSNGAEQPDEPSFWFVLDAAPAQHCAVPLLHGRPWTELFDRIDEDRTRRAARESLAWSERQPPHDEFARANAERARRYLEHGEWIAKEDAR